VEDDETFIVVNVNRNQPRKDIGRSLLCWHEFHKKYPNSLYYLHTCMQDLGGNLPLMAAVAGLNVTGRGRDMEIMFSPHAFSLQSPFSRGDLNKVYNAANLLISSSTGEGWGLATTEAMAAGTPVLVPGNTANLDIVGEHEERGYFIKTGGDIDHTIWMYGHASQPRDCIHSNSCIAQLEHIYLHRQERQEKARAAQRWALDHTWKAQGRKWQELLKALDGHLSQESQAKTAVTSQSSC
jgi:glycosyltransferase involved in cell wall biosynthesis